MISQRTLVTVLVIIITCSVVLSQNVLSNDHENPTVIEFDDFLPYVISSDVPVNDISFPSCGRLYPGFSSYLSFTVPELKHISANLKTGESSRFGMAIYIKEGNELIELICENYNSDIGSISLRAIEDYVNKSAILRIWFMDISPSKDIELAVFLRPVVDESLYHKNVNHQSRKDYYSVHSEYGQKLNQLQESHKQIGQLPYSTEYIFQHIFPEIRLERHTVAPNFPERGSSAEETDQNMKNWINNYEDEYIKYIDFLQEKLNYYQKKSISIE